MLLADEQVRTALLSQILYTPSLAISGAKVSSDTCIFNCSFLSLLNPWRNKDTPMKLDIKFRSYLVVQILTSHQLDRIVRRDLGHRVVDRGVRTRFCSTQFIQPEHHYCKVLWGNGNHFRNQYPITTMIFWSTDGAVSVF
ncbi:Vegetative incompatibility protein HET-E-1 [Fusarium oxysporum f. sp. albedinis]|nr:Vegetative incompatibility protein HET-E-1 [Fusarium oxysporum f. sp. albedinis]